MQKSLWLFATAALSAASGAGCSNSPTTAPERSATDSHERMVEELAAIAFSKPYERITFGGVSVDQAESNLKNLPDMSMEKRIEYLYRLGKRRLWNGDTREAVTHLRAAYELVQHQKNRRPGSPWEIVVFQLGLAYLRLGENENCVECSNGESCLLPIRGAGVHQNQEGSRNAIEYFTLLLAENPKHLESRWLLNVAFMTIGQYPDGVPPDYRIDPKRFDSDSEFPRFENIASVKGVGTVNLSGGSIMDDFDGDGDLDLITSSWGCSDPLLYFRNDAGRFINASEDAGLAGLVGGLNLVQADFDNDGDVDVLVLRGAWMQDAGKIPNSLLKNDGSGRFRDVTFDCGLGDVNYPTQTAAWFDFDNDGDLDLYVGNEHGPCQLFENDGTGHFRDVALAAGVQNNGFTKGVVCADFNNDRYPDIYVSNLGQNNRLFLNNRDGTFTDVAVKLNVTGPRMSFATWFWDFNQDGVLDLYVSSYSYGLNYIGQNYFAEPQDAELDAVYMGDGKGGFSEVARELNLVGLTQPMGANFGDLDNDGYPDFYLGTGYPGYEGLMPNLMYLNQKGKRFADVTTAGGFGHLQKGHGIVFADFDNDGDQDVFSQMGGAFPGDRAANCLYENPGFGNHWITIKLVGEQSNRSAIGARIEAAITENGRTRTVYKWVGSGGSFGANPLRQEIGLGKASQIDRLTIYWPTSNTTQIFENVAVDQFIEISEDASSIKVSHK